MRSNITEYAAELRLAVNVTHCSPRTLRVTTEKFNRLLQYQSESKTRKLFTKIFLSKNH